MHSDIEGVDNTPNADESKQKPVKYWHNLPKQALHPSDSNPLYSHAAQCFFYNLDLAREHMQAYPNKYTCMDDLRLVHTSPVTVRDGLGRCGFADVIKLAERANSVDDCFEPRSHAFASEELIKAFDYADRVVQEHFDEVLYYVPMEIAVDLTDFDEV